MAASGEDFGGEADGLGKVAGHLSECGEEEVAEVVAFEFAAGTEAVLEEAGDEVLVLRERDHAVAQVAGWEHFEVFAEAAAGPAIVRDGDDGGEVADPDGDSGFRLDEGACPGEGDDVMLEASQEG